MLFFTTIELCARFEATLRWQAPFFGPYSSDVLRVTDEIGTRNRPGARFEKWAINSAGFRGPELALVKPADTLRVGVAGASEIFGLYESPEKDVVAQLQTLLSTAWPGRFEVVNLASAGMSPPRIGELIERWAGRFDFDVIVIYPTPAFYLDLEPPRRRVATRPSRPVPTSGPVLRFPAKAWSAARQQLPSGLQAWLKRMGVERQRRAHPPDWVWRAAPPERLQLFEEDVRELVERIERAGARPILATHANRFTPPLTGKELDQMDGWIRFYPRATGECLLDMEQQANDALRRLSQQRGISVVDVQAAVGKDPRHYADFSHFTDEGAARAAAALAQAILEADVRREDVRASR